MRVVSLLPSATEIVFALGRGDDLVGVTFECDHPVEARSRRIVSTSALPSGLSPAEIDAIVSTRVAAGEDLYHLDEGALAELDADVVLTQDICAVCAIERGRVDDALAYLGCHADVVTLDPHTLDDVLATVTTVGEALGAEDRGTALTEALQVRLDRLASRLDGVERPRVLTLEWTDPPFTAGHWVPDLVTAGGGVAVLAHPGQDSRRATWAEVAAAAADVVVVAPCGYHLPAATDLAYELVEHDRLPEGAEVWAVDADGYVVRPGPRLVDGAEILGAILHPERVGPADPARATRVRPA